MIFLCHSTMHNLCNGRHNNDDNNFSKHSKAARCRQAGRFYSGKMCSLFWNAVGDCLLKYVRYCGHKTLLRYFYSHCSISCMTVQGTWLLTIADCRFNSSFLINFSNRPLYHVPNFFSTYRSNCTMASSELHAMQCAVYRKGCRRGGMWNHLHSRWAVYSANR